eukprot:8831725-Karenia_brevis.AAC.1
MAAHHQLTTTMETTYARPMHNLRASYARNRNIIHGGRAGSRDPTSSSSSWSSSPSSSSSSS